MQEQQLSKEDQNQNKAQKLLENFKLGDLTLQNRVIMSPLTRCRAGESGIPNDLMKEYYTQRAGFGLILTECTKISPLSNSYPGSGGIYNQEQVEGWKKVVDSVHQKGGLIFLQIWHCGRSVPSEFINGELPLAPSPVPQDAIHEVTNKPYPTPKEMTQEDIDQVVEQFRIGAENAKKAGFDGLELHGANGFIVDQFLKDLTNKRTDQYGGSFINRCRFMNQVLDALLSVYPPERVGIRLSPNGRFNEMYDSNPIELYKVVLQEIEKKKLAFVEIKRHSPIDVKYRSENDPNVDKKGRILPTIQVPDYYNTWRKLYSGVIIANDHYNQQTAEEGIQNNEFDLVSFGCLSISNPDLPNRFKNNYPVNEEVNVSTFYEGGENGYTTYPEYEQNKL